MKCQQIFKDRGNRIDRVKGAERDVHLLLFGEWHGVECAIEVRDVVRVIVRVRDKAAKGGCRQASPLADGLKLLGKRGITFKDDEIPEDRDRVNVEGPKILSSK